MEYSSMSERILRSIENIVKNDTELQDFSIVPTEDNIKNKSPVLYESHHLGLESWCIKYVYQYICSELFKVRKSLAENKMGYSKREDLNYLLMGGLFINPDVTTFWNMRRELVESDVYNYEEEFRFSKLVLTRKSKSNEAFSYRRWLLKRILEKMSKNGVVPVLALLENELSVSLSAALGSQNNYHAWIHRIWCMKHFSPYFPDVIMSELEFSEKWISEHVSENTGYHYRQFLINLFKNRQDIPVLTRYFDVVVKQLNILNDGEPIQLIVYLLGKPSKNKSFENISKYINYVLLLLHELLIVIENISKVYTEHESLWLHRRYVLFSLLQVSFEYLGESLVPPKRIDFSSVCFNNAAFKNKNIMNLITNDHGEKQPKIFKSQPSKFEASKLYRVLFNSEKSFISNNSNGSAIQTDLAKRYEKWLKLVVGFELI